MIFTTFHDMKNHRVLKRGQIYRTLVSRPQKGKKVLNNLGKAHHKLFRQLHQYLLAPVICVIETVYPYRLPDLPFVSTAELSNCDGWQTENLKIKFT